MLFVGAKVSQFALLPQGRKKEEKSTKHGKTNGRKRPGNCSNTGALK